MKMDPFGVNFSGPKILRTYVESLQICQIRSDYFNIFKSLTQVLFPVSHGITKIKNTL